MMAEFARRSARVILLDASDRLLLVRSAAVPGDPDRGYAWFTPGGGVEAGDRRARRRRQRHYGGHHWWTAAELAATKETIYPGALADLVAELIADRLPAAPVALPWPH